MSIYPILQQLLANWAAFGFLLGLLVIFRLLSTPAFKGWLGERMVRRGLGHLDGQLYRSFHDVYLPRPDGEGTTQLDHVVLSPYGVFVIETKNFKGWIFGSEKQRQWTQQIYRTKHRFQNPLHQNHLHVKALMAQLDLPESCFHSLVFFVGGAGFKSPMPSNVLNQGLLLEITRRTELLLDPGLVRVSEARLESLCKSVVRGQTARDHVRAIQARNVG